VRQQKEEGAAPGAGNICDWREKKCNVRQGKIGGPSEGTWVVTLRPLEKVFIELWKTASCKGIWLKVGYSKASESGKTYPNQEVVVCKKRGGGSHQSVKSQSSAEKLFMEHQSQEGCPTRRQQEKEYTSKAQVTQKERTNLPQTVSVCRGTEERLQGGLSHGKKSKA